MSPKTIGARVPVSRRLMIQSSPDIEMLVRNDIINEITLGVDYTIGYGTGTASQPRGLKNTSGIGSVTMGGGTSVTFSTQPASNRCTFSSAMGSPKVRMYPSLLKKGTHGGWTLRQVCLPFLVRPECCFPSRASAFHLSMRAAPHDFMR